VFIYCLLFQQNLNIQTQVKIIKKNNLQVIKSFFILKILYRTDRLVNLLKNYKIIRIINIYKHQLP
jgi:hypothetical protein